MNPRGFTAALGPLLRRFATGVRRPVHGVPGLLLVGVLVVLAGGVSAATAAGYPAGPAERSHRVSFPQGQLDELESLAREHGSVRTLVRLDLSYVPEGRLDARGRRHQRDTIRRLQRDVLAALRGTEFTLRHRYIISPLLAVDLGPDAVDALRARPAVRSIHLDVPDRPLLAESVPHVQADQLHADGEEGAGGMVVVLDTGMDTDHPAYGARLNAQACFASGEDEDPATGGDCPSGDAEQVGPDAGQPLVLSDSTVLAHGSHVGGIAAGAATSVPDPSLADGVARGADVGSIMVFSESSDPSFCNTTPCAISWASDQIKALEHVADTVASNHEVVSVNMSLGGGSSENPCDDDDPRQPIISTLRSQDIATVAASGNDGETDAIDAPACISDAVAVGATTIDDGSGNDVAETIASFSNQDTDTVDLVAPGRFILSAVPDDASDEFDGTSMAAPHVAGGWVLLHQAAGGDSVDDVEAALIDTGDTVHDDRSGAPEEAAYRSIRLARAFELLVEGNHPPTSDFDFSPSAPEADSEVQFTDASYDPDGTIAAWDWNLGDGTDTTVQNPTHVYGESGDFDVRLVVTDDSGAQDTSVRTVTVGGGSSSGGGGGGSCLIERVAPSAWTASLRRLRDALLLEGTLGRRLTAAYYRGFGPRGRK